MMSIYNSIVNSCKGTTIHYSDINDKTFFGKMVTSPVPEELSPLEVLDLLSDGWQESEYKLIIHQGFVGRLDVDMMDCMIDTEDVEVDYIDIYHTYDEVVNYLNNKGNGSMVYMVSKEFVDSEITFSLAKLTRGI